VNLVKLYPEILNWVSVILDHLPQGIQCGLVRVPLRDISIGWIGGGFSRRGLKGIIINRGCESSLADLIWLGTCPFGRFVVKVFLIPTNIID